MAQAFVLSAIPGIKHIGTPLMRHYNRADFDAGRQTWMIGQGNNGMMYFANNDGLLEFDGTYWNIYPLPNQTIVRCISIASDDRIYAGGFNEFGYYAPDSSGGMAFHSLRDRLPEGEEDFGDIWKVHLTPFGIIFQSFTRLFILENEQVQVIPAPDEFHFSFYVKGDLYVVDREKGLMRLAFGNLFPVVGTESLRGKEIWGILALDDHLLMATSGDGIFRYDGGRLETWAPETSRLLGEYKVFCMEPAGEDAIAFGTIQNGLVITDLEGKVIQSINREQGLQNNTVLSLGSDGFGNLWMGLDNGIDYLEINSPLSLLSYQHGLNSGYAALIADGILYLGTNQGVYAADWQAYSAPGNQDITFRLVENTGGQVWVLQQIDGWIFCGHNNGTFLIEGYRATRISDIPGGWKYQQLNADPDRIIAGTYSGFIVFSRENDRWNYSHRVRGFNESSRDFIQDDQDAIWMSHGLKGIYRIDLNESLDSVDGVSFYNASSGLPSDYVNTVVKFRDSVYITTEAGIYHYEPASGQMRLSAFMTRILGKEFYRKITIDDRGNIWYFSATRSGVFRLQEDGSYLDISLPFEQVRNSFIGGFEFVYPYSGQHVFFGVENGFIHYDPSFSKDYTHPIRAYIRRVASGSSDSVLFSGIITDRAGLPAAIDFGHNSLQFFFSASEYENPDRIEYSTFMSGLEDGYTGWVTQSTREFTRLHEGDYIFHVRARNIYGVASPPVSVAFTIRPPWRRSPVALVLYGILFLLGAYAGFLLVRRKINRSKLEAERAKERQFKLREEELTRASLEAEKEVIRLRNENLREEMRLKDMELANSTLQTIQKNKLLVSLRDELKKLGSMSQDEEVRAQIRLLTRKINRDIDADSQWKVFETQFEKVHEEFLERIKAQYPELTPRELKLCAYLRLNISSKEIALLMNISTRGVEISRYRLRKKLNLDHDTNLTDFIISF